MNEQELVNRVKDILRELKWKSDKLSLLAKDDERVKNSKEFYNDCINLQTGALEFFLWSHNYISIESSYEQQAGLPLHEKIACHRKFIVEMTEKFLKEYETNSQSATNHSLE